MTVSPLLIGIGAGLVAATLFASLANNSMLAATLFYLTPLPILLAGIGWGVRAAQIAFVTAALLVAIVLNFTSAIAFSLCIGLPGVVLSYLMLLRREHPLGRRVPRPRPGGPVDRVVSARPHRCLGLADGRRSGRARPDYCWAATARATVKP